MAQHADIALAWDETKVVLGGHDVSDAVAEVQVIKRQAQIPQVLLVLNPGQVQLQIDGVVTVRYTAALKDRLARVDIQAIETAALDAADMGTSFGHTFMAKLMEALDND